MPAVMAVSDVRIVVVFQLKSATVNGHTSYDPGSNSSEENGMSVHGSQEELEPEVNSETLKDDPVAQECVPRPDSPVPGTSKSSGVCRRTSKDSKRSSPDTADGLTAFYQLLLDCLLVVVCVDTLRVFLCDLQDFLTRKNAKMFSPCNASIKGHFAVMCSVNLTLSRFRYR